MNKLTFFFGAAVALVVLIDLATGQGPPVYTQYIQAQQQQAYPGPPPPPPPPPAIALHPVGYVQRGEYEKEQLGKEGGHGKNGLAHHKHHLKKHESDRLGYEKIEKKDKGVEYKEKELDEKEYYDEYKSTPAPGVLSSFSNSMSGAWDRITHLGRSTRSVDEPKEPGAAGNASIAAIKPAVASDEQAAGKSSQARGMDSYELLHQKSNGYIYFKVPKHLVCGY